MIFAIVIPRQASLHVALLVELLVVRLGLLVGEQFDGLGVSLGGLCEILFGFVAVADAQVTTE